MTELQIAIAAAAVVALLWIVYNNIREQRKGRDLAARRSPEQEPVLSAFLADRPIGDPPAAQADAIAVMGWSVPMSVSRIEQQIKGWRRSGTKPVVFGWPGDQGQFTSEPSTPTVLQLQVGLLLATRSGPLNAIEFSEWQAQLEAIASALEASLQLPAMNETLERARTLDRDCAEVDAQLSLCVQTPQSLSLDGLKAAAEKAGLIAQADTRFVCLDEAARTRFTVFPGDQGNRLVLLLDMPRTAEPMAAYQRMQLTALSLAEQLSGSLVDEAGRSLGPKELLLIEGQVQSRSEQLQALGIQPGSGLALRLFQ